MALVPSMIHKTAMVRTNHMKNVTVNMTICMPPDDEKPFPSVIDHKTTESC